jgi:hypothetical protein
MIKHCPYCGAGLPRPILHGITSCNNCVRVFDSSLFNKILSAAWFIRRKHPDPELLVTYGYDPYVVSLVMQYEHHSHEEFVKALKQLNISEDYETSQISGIA